MQTHTCASCGYRLSKNESTRSFAGKFCPKCGVRLRSAAYEEEQEAMAFLGELQKRFRQLASEPTSHHLGIKVALVALCVVLVETLGLSAYRTMIPAEPTESAFELALGQALAEQAKGDMGSARTHLLTLQKDYPKEPEVLNSLGFMSKLEGDVPTAKQYFASAHALDGNNVVANQNLGAIARTEGNAPAAREYFSAVLSVEPDNAVVKKLIAELN